MKASFTNILGVKVNSTNYKDTLRSVENWIKMNKKKYICVSNVHAIMECQKDPKLLKGVNASDLVTPDGMPLVWLSKLYGKKKIKRVYGPTLMLKLCNLAQKEGYKIYLLGGVNGLSRKLTQELRRKYSGINIVGYRDTPIRPIPKKDNEKIIKEINGRGPQILFVGLGCPYQELWMIENRKKINAGILIGVGSAFDYFSGYRKQAPVWMQRGGLEWLFRFFQEPKRLWYRYTITNLRFIHKIFTQLTSDFLINN